MDYRHGRQAGKFYAGQVEEVNSLLGRYVQEQAQGLSLAKYFSMCEQLEKTPDPTKMPLERSVFPEQVQAAFLVYELMSDRWDTNSGMYMGKDWAPIAALFDILKIQEDKEEILLFIKMIETKNINLASKETERKRKADDRKRTAAGGGQQYSHNVKG